MKFKDLIIYSDLDGTLLTTWDQGPLISNENIKAIKDFQTQGGLFSIATGRNLQNVMHLFDNITFELPMVLVNGALVYDCNHKKILNYTRLDVDFCKELIAYFAQSNRVSLVISDFDTVYHVIHPHIPQQDLPALDFKTTAIDMEKAMDLTILKMVLVTDPKDRLDIEQDILSLPYASRIHLAASSTRFAEIVSKGVSKANSIDFVLNHLQISDRKLVCIGDYLNDKEMLDHADIAAIPENGLDELKKPGRIITTHHNEHALADLIKQLKHKQ